MSVADKIDIIERNIKTAEEQIKKSCCACINDGFDEETYMTERRAALTNKDKKSGRYHYGNWLEWIHAELDKNVSERMSEPHAALILQAAELDTANERNRLLAAIRDELAVINRRKR